MTCIHLIGHQSHHDYDSIEEKKETIGYKLDSLRKLVGKADLLKPSGQTIDKQVISYASPVEKIEVFIVNGHDDSAKNKTARFIERLGIKPIILHEQASSGSTIIEKIEEFSNVGFGIILYTPCDLAVKQKIVLKLALVKM